MDELADSAREAIQAVRDVAELAKQAAADVSNLVLSIRNGVIAGNDALNAGANDTEREWFETRDKEREAFLAEIKPLATALMESPEVARHFEEPQAGTREARNYRDFSGYRRYFELEAMETLAESLDHNKLMESLEPGEVRVRESGRSASAMQNIQGFAYNVSRGLYILAHGKPESVARSAVMNEMRKELGEERRKIVAGQTGKDRERIDTNLTNLSQAAHTSRSLLPVNLGFLARNRIMEAMPADAVHRLIGYQVGEARKKRGVPWNKK